MLEFFIEGKNALLILSAVLSHP